MFVHAPEVLKDGRLPAEGTSAPVQRSTRAGGPKRVFYEVLSSPENEIMVIDLNQEPEDSSSIKVINREPGSEVSLETDEWELCGFQEKDWEAFQEYYENTPYPVLMEDLKGDLSVYLESEAEGSYHPEIPVYPEAPVYAQPIDFYYWKNFEERPVSILEDNFPSTIEELLAEARFAAM